MNTLNEITQPNYDFGCVMLYFEFPEMKYLHKLVDPEDIYTEENDYSFGLGDKSHTTLLFGLHDTVSFGDVKNVMDEFKFGNLVAHNPSLFQNEKYDVLKFDIKYPTKGDEFLHKCNEELKKFPHTSDSPNYHPHMTIAYLKPGKGVKYLRKIGMIEYNLTPEYGVYSQSNGDKRKISLK